MIPYLILLTTPISPDVCARGKLPILKQGYRYRCRVTGIVMVIVVAMEQEIKDTLTIRGRGRASSITSGKGDDVIARFNSDRTVTRCS